MLKKPEDASEQLSECKESFRLDNPPREESARDVVAELRSENEKLRETMDKMQREKVVMETKYEAVEGRLKEQHVFIVFPSSNNIREKQAEIQ